jgi:hypothetical protein
MWNFTQAGFFSIVEHRDGPEHLLVRSRVREDLVRLADELGLAHRRIQNDPLADYRWRMKAPRQLVARYLSDCVKAIDYTTSVKDQLDLGEPVRHSAMLGVWTAMMRLQTAGKYNVAPLGVTAAGDVDLHAPSYFRWDDPDDQTLAELDDETDWFLGEEALDEIRDILDGGTWGEHSLNAIADVIRNTGRDVHRAI